MLEIARPPGQNGHLLPATTAIDTQLATLKRDIITLLRMAQGGVFQFPRVIYGYPSVLSATSEIRNPRFGAVLRNRKTFGAVFRYCKSFGAVRAVLKNGKPTVRFGAVFRSALYLTVRFSEIRNPTVRFGAVFRYRKSYGSVPR